MGTREAAIEAMSTRRKVALTFDEQIEEMAKTLGNTGDLKEESKETWRTRTRIQSLMRDLQVVIDDYRYHLRRDLHGLGVNES
jgi:hypothetical protein